MKKNNYFIFVLMLSSAFLQAENQEGFEWWQSCLGNTVSYKRFATWLGGTKSPSRIAMRQYVLSKGYTSLLDVPCGLCVDYIGLKREAPLVKYQGLDITPKLVNRAIKRGINATLGDIQNIPFEDSAFDIVYARHILEHLPYYEKACEELVRVAKYEAFVVFFIPAVETEDVIDFGISDGHMVYHNRYNRAKLEQFVLALPKVSHITWETISKDEEILHIFVSI